MKNKILTLTAAITGLLFSSCHNSHYEPLEHQAFIAQTGMQSYESVTTLVHDKPSTASFNIRLSHPAESEQNFQIFVEESVVEAYNERTGKSLFPLPKEQFEINAGIVTVAKGNVVSEDITLQVHAPTQEMKDSGRSYAIGIRVSGDTPVLKGSDRIVVIIDQPAIQDVVQFNKRSNIELKLNDEIELTTWTVEYFVNMSKLGKAIKELNNQAIFGAWGSGVEVDGVNRQGEIYSRFGDAPIEGNRFQVKTKGTQVNSNILFEENTWYHIAIVCSETKLELYVDGELDNSIELPSGSLWLNHTFGLGNTSYLESDVRIAQLRLWDVARTPTQIKNSMTRVDPKSEGLVAYWKFDEGSGDVFKDATGKNPDAVTKDNGRVIWIKDVNFDERK